MKLPGFISLLFTVSVFANKPKGVECAVSYKTEYARSWGGLRSQAKMGELKVLTEFNDFVQYEVMLNGEGLVNLMLQSRVTGTRVSTRVLNLRLKNGSSLYPSEFVKMRGGDLGKVQENGKVYDILEIKLYCHYTDNLIHIDW
jgi:hypothetical protein